MGIDKFREFFDGYQDHYAIIGGTACDLLFGTAGLSFRATKDIDVVLCVEIVGAAFGERFRDFLNEGGYEAREQSNGHREFYRFHKPTDKDFPYMVELFSRTPGTLTLPDDVDVIRLDVEDDIVSLSAILLDEDYFTALQSGKRVENGVTILDQSLLIPFKAKAFLDLTERRAAGDEKVKGNDIKKHRNDVIRLSQLLPNNANIEVNDTLREDLKQFLDAVEGDERLVPPDFNVPMSRDEVVGFLRSAYGLA